MFPGANAQVYYNEAGEPLGWDYPSYDDPYDPDDDLAHPEDEMGYPYDEPDTCDGCNEVEGMCTCTVLDEED